MCDCAGLTPISSSDPAPPLVIVVAHPGDDVAAAGAQLHRWRHAHVIHVTDGEPVDATEARNAGFASTHAYGLARQREALTALGRAGFRLKQIHQIEFPSQTASSHLMSLTGMLADKFFELQPEIVVTQPYEGA